MRWESPPPHAPSKNAPSSHQDLMNRFFVTAPFASPIEARASTATSAAGSQ